MEHPFSGRGWSFPPTFNRTTSGVEMLEGEADIVSSLQVLLSTIQGERVMLPQYGCNLLRKLHASDQQRRPAEDDQRSRRRTTGGQFLPLLAVTLQ